MSKEFFPKTGEYYRNCEVLEGGSLPPGMVRVALAVEYNGACFHGFQSQPGGVTTVQLALEKALSKIANEEITLICAGRTDAGVHATGQIVHFDTLAQRPNKAWVLGVNAELPDTVSVRWAKQVPAQFHARFSATARAYRYVICNSYARPALQFDQLTWERRELDVSSMEQGAQLLVGRHDFSSFRASQCQAKSPVREITHMHLYQRGELLVIEVKANAFLHHMVRNMVGVLLAIGTGEQAPKWVSELLQVKDRRQAGVTAKPHGLYLVAVDYPEHFDLPQLAPGPHFFSEPVGGFALK